MRVFVTGSNGFIGSAICRRLLSAGHQVVAMVRREPRRPPAPGFSAVVGELPDSVAALPAALAGCDAVVHLVGIIREQPSAGVTFSRVHVEATRSLLALAGAAGVRRWVHMSALGARGDAPAVYHQTKYQAEQLVRESSIASTILRPSLVLGSGGEFLTMMAGWATRRSAPYLAMPFFGGGVLGLRRSHIQPVRVEDVAEAFLAACLRPDLSGRTINVVGPAAMTWPQLYRACRDACGTRTPTLGIPAWYAMLLARCLPASLLPFTRDQVIMAGEDNTADAGEVESLLGRPPGEVDARWIKGQL